MVHILALMTPNALGAVLKLVDVNRTTSIATFIARGRVAFEEGARWSE